MALKIRSGSIVTFLWGFLEHHKETMTGRIDTVSVGRQEAMIWTSDHRLVTVPFSDILERKKW